MTPRQFSALLDRREIELDRQKHSAELSNSMIAQLTAMLVNFGFRSPETPVTYKDFMPSSEQPKQKMSKKVMREIVADQVRAMNKAMADQEIHKASRGRV